MKAFVKIKIRDVILLLLMFKAAQGAVEYPYTIGRYLPDAVLEFHSGVRSKTRCGQLCDNKATRPLRYSNLVDKSCSIYAEKPEKKCREERPKEDVLYEDCAAIKEANCNSISGSYKIQVKNETNNTVLVYCDMETLGGGWTVFQRRINGSESFARNWTDYKVGFGNVMGEFWLGNFYLSKLTNNDEAMDLLIEMKAWDRPCLLDAQYSNFRIADENENFRLNFRGFAGGIAGDSLHIHQNMQFTKRDKDNDQSSYRNCANARGEGGWWYKNCASTHLNGVYHRENCVADKTGILYHSIADSSYYSLEGVEMKFRKSNYRQKNDDTNWCATKNTCRCDTPGAPPTGC